MIRGRAAVAGLEPVHALVGDDVDAVLADRERVLDLLAERLRTLSAPVFGSSVPTLPFSFETNQIRPLKSGSAEVIRSVAGSSTEVRS